MDQEACEYADAREAADCDIVPLDASLPRNREAGATIPDYLSRYYAWAYLWRASVWFFDHQPIINAILLGCYRRIMNEAVRLIDPPRAGRTLQVAAVYGELSPVLAGRIADLCIVDVAPIQLAAARRKLESDGVRARLECMNTERLLYEDDAFDSALMYLLLHEMPARARDNSLREAVRILRPGGKLVIAEYGELRRRHPLHRLAPFRWLLTSVEPFLDGFWRQDLTAEVQRLAGEVGKRALLREQVDILGGFYRVMRFDIQ